MSKQEWSKSLKSVVQKTETSNKNILEEHIDEISSIADEVIDILADGFQWADIISFFKVVSPLMELTEKIDQYNGEEKEQFVVDAVWMIYETVDTYPDGESNRINIPILFGGLEKKFEKEMVNFVARAAIKAVHAFGKEKGYF